MKVLVTGASGFVGRHFISELVRQNYEVIATFHKSQPSILCDKVIWQSLDITDKSNIQNIIAKFQPNIIFHLAAQSHVPTAFDKPEETYKINFLGTHSLLDVAETIQSEGLFVFVSTGAVYGESFKQGVSVNENILMQPMDPYAVSKAAAELMLGQKARKSKWKVLRLRPFNHFGPGQLADFVIPAFAKQVAEIELNKRPPLIHVGDLTPMRDFLFIDDVIEAYLTIIREQERIQSGEIINICSGEATQIQKVLDILRDKVKVNFEVQVDSEKLRPVEIPVAVGNNSKMESLGWSPIVTLEEGISKTLDYFREKNY